MQVRLLVAGEECDIVAVMVGGECPAEDFLKEGEKATEAWRDGLFALLERVADEGLQNLPTVIVRQANKQLKISEFRKGKLRLFFFKGEGRQVAVCTSGVMKKTQKADLSAVRRSASWRVQYFEAIEANILEVIHG